jgi:hypothetical protein
MPFFNDRRNSDAPRDIALPWDSDPAPKPTPPKPLTKGQQRNAELDKSIAYVDKSVKSVPHGNRGNMNNGWMARGQFELKRKTATYDKLMGKVGEASPRYNQLLAAKERTVAGMNRSVGNSAGMSRTSNKVSPQGYTPPRNGKQAMFGPNTVTPNKVVPKGPSAGEMSVNNRAFYDNESRNMRANKFLTSPENKAYYANKKKK